MKRVNPKEDLNFYRLSKFDIILIILAVFFSIISIPGVTRGSRSSDAKVALINIEGKLYQRVDLKEDKIITLPVHNEAMQVEVKGGKIRVVKSDCPRQICVFQGAIAYPRQTIVCVPNKVLIEVKSAAPFLDAVVR